MPDDGQTQLLRRQRNRYAVAAVLMVLVSMAVSLPRALARRNTLKALNGELLQLQGSMLDRQQKIRAVQAEIIRAQDEIRALSAPR